MASTSTLAHPNRPSRLRTLFLWSGWAAAGAIGVYFFAVAVSRYTHFDAAHYRSHWTTRWWLVAHLGGGSLALVLGPLQFSSAIRRRFPQVHRWMGRVYLVGVLVASIAAVYMSLYVAEKAFGDALLYLALAWVTTSAMAYVAVRRRQFAAHREWMIRSYVVTFGFVSFRLMSNLDVYGSLSRQAQEVMLAWLAWAVPLLLTEVVLQWRRTMGLTSTRDSVYSKGERDEHARHTSMLPPHQR